MLESAETGVRIPKTEYKAALPALRTGLIDAQTELRRAGASAVVLLAGDDPLGQDEVLDRLHEWMDARYLDANVFLAPTEEERERPRSWRYWRCLPAAGRIGIYVGGWPVRMVDDRLRGKCDEAELASRAERARRFEESLVADGALLVKFWLHLPRKELEERLSRAKSDPERAWLLEEEDTRIHERYVEAMPIVERVLAATHSPGCVWHVIESTDDRTRDLSVARILLAALRARLDGPPAEAAAPPAAGRAPATSGGALDAIDLAAKLGDEEYEERLEELQARLVKLSRRARRKERSSVLVFEGWDAAGKGGAIRRITGPMHARDYKVFPISAPSEEEKSRHYLWRFWRALPGAGRMAIFDRSWYGRVLVERVEGFASEAQWRRAYGEILDFEAELLDHGIPVAKFWLHIDEAEQARRFEARMATGYKKYKYTAEDIRNRSKRAGYVEAVEEMVARTSTERAPWHLISSQDKRWARVQVLERVCEALERATD